MRKGVVEKELKTLKHVSGLACIFVRRVLHAAVLLYTV